MKHYVIRQRFGFVTMYLTTFNEFTQDQRKAVRMKKSVAKDTAARLHRGRNSATYVMVRLRAKRRA